MDKIETTIVGSAKADRDVAKAKRNPMKKFPEAVVGILIFNKAGEVLLIKGPKWSNKYAMPGGHIAYGERMADTVRREALEETGLKVRKIEPIRAGEFIFREGGDSYKGHFVYVHFSCIAAGTEVRLNDEADSCMWVRPKEALKLNLAKFTRDTVVAFLGKHGRPGELAIYKKLA